MGIVLAAGTSQRAGFPKALARLDGESFVARVTRALAQGGARDVVIVTGPPHAARVERALSETMALDLSLAGVRFAHNPAPESGMLSSLQVGLRTASALHAEPPAALVVALVDQPHLAPQTVRALIAAWRTSDADLVRPRHDGRRGHPFVLSRTLGHALLGAPLERTVRELLAAVDTALEVDVADAAVLEDLDTAADVSRAGAQRP